MSQTRKTISKLLGGSDSLRNRSCLDPAEMNHVIHRERDRSDRRDIPFSLLILHSHTRSEATTEAVTKQLFGRLRLTDDIAVLDSYSIGILLPDTEGDFACQLAAELESEFQSILKGLTIEVFTYPFEASGFDEDRLEDDSIDDGVSVGTERVPDTRHGPQKPLNSNSKVGHKIQAKSLSFAVPMPFWKRSLDIAVSTGTLLVLAPFFLLTAVIIKLTSRGPIFFSQWREGKNGQKFKIYKFRTMHLNAESLQNDLRHLSEQDGPAFKIENDPRLTWFGSFLRKSCFDETPQFINILRGDMTLVGPRPLPVNESQACSNWQRRRLDVTPGMTCIWQVYGDRHIGFDQWMRMDEEYIRTASFWTDIKILCRTALFVLLRRASV